MTSVRRPPAAARNRLLSKGRLEAFSDGVFAIVITLLVLELQVPAAGKELRDALVEEWPAYLGYLISFAFIGGAWIAHSTTTRFIRAVDAAWMRLNLLLLLFVSFLPFTTSLMASHLNQTDARTVTVIFGVDLTLAAVMQSVLIAYSARTPGLAADDVAEVELSAFARERRLAIALPAASTVLALFLPTVAVLLFLLVSVLLLLEPLVRVPREPRSAPASSGSPDEVHPPDEDGE